MKTKRWLFLLLLVFGCYLPPDLPRDYFSGEDTAVCIAARPVSFTTDFTFETDVMILSGWSKDYAIEYLDTSGISFTGPGQYVVESVNTVTLPPRPHGPVAILVDQSGTWEAADSSNFRSKQLNQFIYEMQQPRQFLLGGFAKDGLLADAPVEYATVTFTSDAESIMPFLFGLAKRTGGQSVLYDAVVSAAGKFSPGANNSLLMIVHNVDSVSGAAITDAVNAALAQSMKIDLIFLGSPADALTLSSLSLGTGGLFVTCTEDGNMITATNQLNNIFNGQPLFFRIKVRYTPPAPLASGQDTFHTMIIHDALYDVNYNPVSIYVRTP